MERYKLFISHHSYEWPIADALKTLLKEALVGHAEIFISFEIPKGTDWLQQIKSKLVGADEIITIFTEHSADRPWINIETGFGVMSGKPATPLLCQGYLVKDLSIIYQLQQSVDWKSKNDVLRLYNDIHSRIKKHNDLADVRWSQEQFWEKWENIIYKAAAKVPTKAIRNTPQPLVWFLGSHSHLENKNQQQKALQACQTIARACLNEKYRIVMGTSRMLEYLADSYEEFMENPVLLAKSEGEIWRKTIAIEHAQSLNNAPNPLVMLGSLRKRGVREAFNDSIGLIPDIAILIGGRPLDKPGRASVEQKLANEAGIPLLPLRFTGGAAGSTECTLDRSLSEDVKNIENIDNRLDEFGPAIVSIIEKQTAIGRASVLYK